mmetsp:Transcript_34455/g.61940  ORF Transcript_34455/g.61940 Transcript_34455/m.61940 type:complete len:94 (-) Transcript_34455:1047-1328(-)
MHAQYVRDAKTASSISIHRNVSSAGNKYPRCVCYTHDGSRKNYSLLYHLDLFAKRGIIGKDNISWSSVNNSKQPPRKTTTWRNALVPAYEEPP